MDAAVLIRECRARSGLTKRAFADRVGTSRSALDLIENGERVPGLDLLNRIAAVGDQRLGLVGATDLPVVEATLADHTDAVDVDDPTWSWRWLTADFVANSFVPASTSERIAMLDPAPAGTGDRRWDRFVTALAEHLAVHADLDRPAWVDADVVEHESFWWPVHGSRSSTRAAAMSHSPASFARRGIFVDGRELPRVVP